MLVGAGLPDTCGGCDPSGAVTSFSEGATQPAMIKKAIRMMIIRSFRAIYVGDDKRIKINLPECAQPLTVEWYHLLLIRESYERTKKDLITQFDPRYHFYENGVFKAQCFASYVKTQWIPGDITPNGISRMKEKSFRSIFCTVHPCY